jgi:hypothetical protein
MQIASACIVCGDELEVTESWWRCPRSVSHPSGATPSEIGMGDFFRRDGIAWAALSDRHKVSVPDGWRSSYRGGK